MGRQPHVRVWLAFSVCAAALPACGGGHVMLPEIPATLEVAGFPAAGTSQSLAEATTYALSAKETAAGGSPVTPGALTITLDNAAIGTVRGSTLVTGLSNESGHVKVADAKTGLSETFAVSVLATVPIALGDTLTLAGTRTETTTYAEPSPSAAQTPSVSTESLTDVVKTTSTNATFGNANSLTDENVVETSPYDNVTSDVFLRFVPAGAMQDLFEDGDSTFDSNLDLNATTTFLAGAGRIDELPDVDGATWTDPATQTYDAYQSEDYSIDRSVNADGTYSEEDQALDVGLTGIETNADLSGSTSEYTFFNGASQSLTFGPPSGSGPGATIPISFTSSSSSASPAPPPIVETFPVWYPTRTIYSDRWVKATNRPLPAGCAVAKFAGSTAVEIGETKKHLDTALGTFEDSSESVFEVPGFGAACVQLADEIDSYYDYSVPAGPSGFALAVLTTPYEVDKTVETLHFASGSIAGSSVSRSAPSALAARVALRAVAPAFERAVDALRRRIARPAFLRRLRAEGKVTPAR